MRTLPGSAIVSRGFNRRSQGQWKPERLEFRHNRTRALLVITEVALAVVLMIGASLLIRTFIEIRQVNPGFDAHNVLTMRMLPTGPRFEDAGEGTRIIGDGLRRVRALPGVEAAAVSCCLPLEDRFYTGVPSCRRAGV